MAANAASLPYLVWESWVDLAVIDERALHFIATAHRLGTFGALARRHIDAAMTEAMQAKFKANFTSLNHFSSMDAAMIDLMGRGFNMGSYPPLRIPHWIGHCTADCGTCFRFLESYGILVLSGCYDPSRSYFMEAGMRRNFALMHYMIQTGSINFLCSNVGQVPGLNGAVVLSVLGFLASREKLTRAWIARINRPETPSNWRGFIDPHDMLDLAPWIDADVAQVFLDNNVNILRGCAGLPKVNWQGMFARVLADGNPNRVSLFEHMQNNDPGRPFSGAQGYWINELNQISFSLGMWPPWALALYLEDTQAATWFAGRPEANPLVLAEFARLGGVGLSSFSGNDPTGTALDKKYIGYFATLNITQDNLYQLMAWVDKASGPITTAFQSTPVPRPQAVNDILARIFDILESIIKTLGKERISLECKMPNNAEREKEKQNKVDIAARMLEYVLENIIALGANTGIIGANTGAQSTILSDLPEYHTWLEEIKAAQLPEIGQAIRVLEGERTRLTRSGQRY